MDTIYRFPPIYAIDERFNGNVIQQLVLPSYETTVTVDQYDEGRVKGHLIKPLIAGGETILAITNMAQPPDKFEKVLRVKTGKSSTWIKHPKLSDIASSPIDYKAQVTQVLESWQGTFKYVMEDQSKGIPGLRSPQIGAVHAIHAHWTVSNEPATIVMPTGTGKTETMLSVLVSSPCQKLLVIVPTDVLRSQIYTKFLTLGILKDVGVLSNEAAYPITGLLRHKPRNLEEIDTFFEKCNVIVTTMNIAGQCSGEARERIASQCPFLFIDEAHHIAAETWSECKEKFEGKRTLQFTATPFRNDDKPVGGDIIYNYPLRKAQEDGYFTAINFKPVLEFDPSKSDAVIAQKAVEQLNEDRKKYDHILMARVGSIQRAEQVFKLYEKYHQFNPVQLHTGIKSIKEREETRRKILEGQSRIVVCVDMLGEGFDLPQLKIAAFHDIRKSLPITLQLAGRFTRSKPDLGEATFIANIGQLDVESELEKLYLQDSDWNIILRKTSEEIVQEQINFQKFIDNFGSAPKEIPLHNLRPAMSAVVYKTKCENWKPESFRNGIQGVDSLEHIYHEINYQNNTLVIVTARKVPIDWLHVGEIFNWDWELYILFWDNTQKLLFIHSSTNNGYFKKLAESVAGEAELVSGPKVFRCFSGINRLKLQNVGLIEQLGRLIKYTMRAGSDVEPGLTEAQKRNVIKSNIFGTGYEEGCKTSIGCSYKGRIWSRSVTNIEALTRWCSFIGSKVLNETIDVESVLRGTLVPIVISERPKKMPIAIEWPDVIYKEPETAYSIVFDDKRNLPLYNFDISLISPAESGDLRFEIRSESTRSEFILSLIKKDDFSDFIISSAGASKASVRYGTWAIPLDEYFNENPPTIWFADGSSLEGNSLTEPKTKYVPFPSEKIQAWDWTGINITKEAQSIAKDKDSIQYKVIQELVKLDSDIIFNDHGSGESADVVSIKIRDKSIFVELYHCKHSMKDTPGKRIEDLYEVCGQAQKSIHWMENPAHLFTHLMAREPQKDKGQENSRFERGDKNSLLKIREMSRIYGVNLKIIIVQPGLSRAEITTAQQELLSVTENYLMETYKLFFGIIASS